MTGISAGIAPGPLTMLVISQTVRYGFREGLATSMAPLITDIPIIIVVIIALSSFREFTAALSVLALAGSCYVVYLAWDCWRARPPSVQSEAGAAQSIRRGALTNFLNPHPYIFWSTVGGPMVVESSQRGLLGPGLFIFFFYLCLVGTKVALAWLIGSSRSIIVGSAYRPVMRILAASLVLFAVFLFRHGLILLGVICS